MYLQELLKYLMVAGLLLSSAETRATTADEQVCDSCVDEDGEDCALRTPGEWLTAESPDFLRSLFTADGRANPLKQQQWGPLGWEAGGELRYRHMHEENRLRAGGPGNTDYDLWRFLPHLQMSWQETASVYVQAIDASMSGLDAPYSPSQIDINRTDLLQCWADVRVLATEDATLKYRFGRQLLRYGGERLLSHLGWANTQRNFEGHKLLFAAADWDVDLFAMQSVNAAAGNTPRPTSFDRADQSRWISGIYSTWKGIENQTLDLYCIHFDESESSIALMDGRRTTIGTRLAGKQAAAESTAWSGVLSWDTEVAWQTGRDNFLSADARRVNAGMLASTVGYELSDVPLKPGAGGIFYYGTGDASPGSGNINTFYTMYPWGHAYWGQIDNFSGQNLIDYGVQGSLKPTEKLSLISQWHYFDLARAADRIYTISGTALAGSGDRHVGTELDLIANYNFSPAFSVQLGYLEFLYGAAVSRSALVRPDAQQIYAQVTWSF